jgi:nicotinamidase-related amidase
MEHWSVTVIDKLAIEPKTTALLLMNFQRMVVDSYAVDKEALLDRVKRLAVTTRNSGVMVIHVVVGFKRGGSDRRVTVTGHFFFTASPSYRRGR